MGAKTICSILLLIALAVLPACDCGSSNDNADGAGPDDDAIVDDDSTLDDDVDDDAGTTTTSPTTSTTAPPTSSTTTTVVTTTTTTTTTMNPGTGTACDPYNKIPTVIDREKPCGPWPEFEERGITFRQIISSGAGQGQNDILFTSDGLAHVAAQDGRSLDVIAVGPAGEVSREAVDPRGGEWKVLGKDDADHLYMLYTVHVDQSPETWEVRAATNKSGAWERETLFTSNDDGNLSLDMAVNDAGLMHIVYCGRDDSAAAYYATWDGENYAETQIAASPGSWLYTYALALDSTGSPHALVSEPTGTWHWRIEDGVWTGDLATANAFAWDIEIDANDVIHAGMAANGGHLVYGKYESGAWTFEDLDDCQDGVSFISVNVDGDGRVHIAYTNGDQDDVLYATNASGAWVHTFLYEENTEFDFGHALDMASALDEDGKLHLVHRRYNDYTTARDSDLNLTTNESGQWVRKRLIKGSLLVFSPAVMGPDDRVHLAFKRNHNNDVVYGLLDGETWSEETVDQSDENVSIGDLAIGYSRQDIPSVLYFFHLNDVDDSSELRLATRESRGWSISTVTDDGDLFAGLQLQFDSLDRPQVVFYTSRGGDLLTIWGQKISTWTFETVPNARFSGSLMIDPVNQPVVAYYFDGGVSEDVRIARQIAANDWETEIALTTDGDTFRVLSSMRDDGSIDLISSIQNDSVMPFGSFYGNDSSGDWEIEHLGIVGRGAFIRDENNQIHYVLWANGGDPEPDPVGLYYMTNMHGTWERYFITTYDGDLHAISIHQRTDGKLVLLHDYYAGQALMTATFEPGME